MIQPASQPRQYEVLRPTPLLLRRRLTIDQLPGSQVSREASLCRISLGPFLLTYVGQQGDDGDGGAEIIMLQAGDVVSAVEECCPDDDGYNLLATQVFDWIVAPRPAERATRTM